ncbi:MAG TPA: MBL fold metallo-hydrolase [Pseudoneobacillus sp.]|nr:MBL fold metallo-hydrolase [Pseudoneobacillus sp.]
MDDTSLNKFEELIPPMTSIRSGVGQAIMPDVYCYCDQIVNLFFIGRVESPNSWVLIDAGMPHSAAEIINEAMNRFGEDKAPEAIILTHGHFDHVGSIADLLEHWDVPVYAHELEIPYLTGEKNYPPGDPTVDGGLVSELSPMFPNHGINISKHVKRLPDDGSVPGLSGWKWFHTPGHTPGHISLFREEDRVLIAGDAFVTVKQESLYKVMVQKQEISGPPKYFTSDWELARNSVVNLEALKPSIAVTGHGLPMTGDELSNELTRLVRDFDMIALPENGRYL